VPASILGTPPRRSESVESSWRCRAGEEILERPPIEGDLPRRQARLVQGFRKDAGTLEGNGQVIGRRLGIGRTGQRRRRRALARFLEQTDKDQDLP